MAEKNIKPEIRFKGFTDDWEERKLNEIADVIGGGTPSTSVLEYWDGDIDWYSPTEIGKEIYAIGSVKKITSLGLEKSSARMLPPNKTVLFTSRAGIGYMAILKRDGATNQGFQSLVVKDGINPYFIYSIGHLIKEYALKHASGSTFLEISGKVLGNMDINIPLTSEQSKIGTYFKNLDHLITLNQHKYDKLVTIKKAMLEKMFPKNGSDVPEIRFKGFEEAWEERKIGELGVIVTGSTPSTQEPLYYSDDGIPWVTPTDISENITFRTTKYLSEEGQRVARVVPKNTILVTSIASIGKNTMLGTSGSFNQQINGLVPKEKEYYPYFLFTESVLWSDKMKRSAASGIMQIVNKTEFSEMKTTVPKLAEQTRIGAFFKNLDDLITVHNRELVKLKNIKKACLEKMFV